MNALSVIKIPIMVLAYRDAEAGRLDLEERYAIRTLITPSTENGIFDNGMFRIGFFNERRFDCFRD